MVISPEMGSYILKMRFVIVDFPDPDYPTRATFWPFLMFSEKFLKIGVSLFAYLNSISWRVISPLILLMESSS